MATTEASLTGLPDELLEVILSFLSPKSLVAVQLTSKRFVDLADEPLLWRHYCQAEFKFWDAKHDIARKLAGPINDVDWKQLFIRRKQINRAVHETFDSILATQQGRIGKIESILDEGYDAKEALLRICNVDDEAEDVLARRYYGNAVLASLHQTLAVQTWEKIRRDEPVPLERALGSFDMFVLGTREGDYDDITRLLDNFAKQFGTENPRFDSLTTREKALALVTFVRARDLTGVKTLNHYSELRNNFIGIALLDPEHQSLPLISVAIYCCIAQRLGINARPCGFPFHIYGVVYAPEQQTLDGKPLGVGKELEMMYLDPFRSDFEVPPENLRSQLLQMGASPSTHASFLREASTRELVLRTGRNIMNSVHIVQQGAPVMHRNGARIPSWITTFPDVDRAFYATSWATMLVSGDADGQANLTLRRRQYLPFLAEQFQSSCPWDASLIEQYIIPLLRNMPEHDRLLDIVHEIRRGDEQPKPIMRRDPEKDKNVKYKIGQMFQHKRYGYEGVIVGWDPKCAAPEDWIMQMGVDSLARGRHQSFYNVMVDDRSFRYVAEDNIQLIYHDPSESLLRLAGRHFKRWDSSTRVFVSNIRDEFPDD